MSGYCGSKLVQQRGDVLGILLVLVGALNQTGEHVLGAAGGVVDVLLLGRSRRRSLSLGSGLDGLAQQRDRAVAQIGRIGAAAAFLSLVSLLLAATNATYSHSAALNFAAKPYSPPFTS